MNSPEYLERREAIIDAAARAFHVRGYDAASLDDVVAELDIRKASLYHYVDSKAQLLYFIFDRAISRGLERMDRIAKIPDGKRRLTALILHQVELIADEPSLFSVFFDNRPRLSPDYEAEMRVKERRYLQRFIEAVELATAQGVIGPTDPKYGAQALLGMTSWIYKWINPESDDWREVARSFIRLILGSDASGDLDELLEEADAGGSKPA